MTEHTITAGAEQRLRARIRHLLARMEQAGKELHEMEEELTQFLDGYYARVGGFIERLDQSGGPSEGSGEPASDTSPPDPYDAQLRHLYRTLAKRHHPDRQQAADKGSQRRSGAQMMQIINHAYECGQLASLWKLHFAQSWGELETRSGPERIVCLSRYHDEIEDALSQLEHRREAVTTSDEYALWQRVYTARLAGHDLVEHIAAQIEQEAEGRRKPMEILD